MAWWCSVSFLSSRAASSVKRRASSLLESRALDRRVIAVRAVNGDALRPYRDSCLLALGSAAQRLRQFFDSSGE